MHEAALREVAENAQLVLLRAVDAQLVGSLVHGGAEHEILDLAAAERLELLACDELQSP